MYYNRIRYSPPVSDNGTTRGLPRAEEVEKRWSSEQEEWRKQSREIDFVFVEGKQCLGCGCFFDTYYPALALCHACEAKVRRPFLPPTEERSPLETAPDSRPPSNSTMPPPPVPESARSSNIQPPTRRQSFGEPPNSPYLLGQLPINQIWGQNQVSSPIYNAPNLPNPITADGLPRGYPVEQIYIYSQGNMTTFTPSQPVAQRHIAPTAPVAPMDPGLGRPILPAPARPRGEVMPPPQTPPPHNPRKRRRSPSTHQSPPSQRSKRTPLPEASSHRPLRGRTLELLRQPEPPSQPDPSGSRSGSGSDFRGRNTFPVP
ncbi:hypothetical protein F5Y10DRAFT_287447 [Nemania abortiva]|nr:hypothetical protein F5Y10DRAFT_287447 [Nemania abortiva]